MTTSSKPKPAVQLSVLTSPCPEPGRRRFVAKLEAPDAAADTCATRVVLAIDKSASMRGRPLRDAQAAACALVDHLDERDEVGLVSFHRRVDETVYPAALTPKFRTFLKEQIHAITPGRGTNIGEACHAGLRLLDQPTDVGRLILLSDGEPSVGVLDHGELVRLFGALRPHCTVSAVGLGDHSDPWLMRALAVAGRGAYAFVPEDASPLLALGAALAGCRGVQADDLRLRFRLPPEVRLRKVFYRGPAARVDGDRAVHLEPLCANDPVHVAFELESAVATPTQWGWLEVSGRYVPTHADIRMRYPLETPVIEPTTEARTECAKQVALARLGVALFDASSDVGAAPARVARWLRERATQVLDELYAADVEAGPEVSALYELVIDLADELSVSTDTEVRRRLVHYGDGAAFRRDSMPNTRTTLAALSRRTSACSARLFSGAPNHEDYE